MAQSDFSIIHDKGNVSFVRNQTTAQRRASVGGQSIKVQCFDSAQVDKIFRYQERGIRSVEQPKSSSIKKYSICNK